jgi:hypothetical protein
LNDLLAGNIRLAKGLNLFSDVLLLLYVFPALLYIAGFLSQQDTYNLRPAMYPLLIPVCIASLLSSVISLLLSLRCQRKAPLQSAGFLTGLVVWSLLNAVLSPLVCLFMTAAFLCD